MVDSVLDQVSYTMLYHLITTRLLLSCAVHVAGSLLYLVQGSDQLQDWAVPREKADNKAEREYNALTILATNKE